METIFDSRLTALSSEMEWIKQRHDEQSQQLPPAKRPQGDSHVSSLVIPLVLSEQSARKLQGHWMVYTAILLLFVIRQYL